ncbi:MAG: YkgJ family cysteine cluster protein [Deltaproteobacteria bacterium]|nr:YkgJ family cysteine cluster protein [Deltaproteobacteria bacterium]
MPVTLVDLIFQAEALEREPDELYRLFYKIGWSPEDETSWVGRLSLELRKPCGFLEGLWCRVYPVRPIGCAEFPEAWHLWSRQGSITAERDRFRHYPCLDRPPAISKEREDHLAALAEMAVWEQWASDFYLFGFSPFYVDLRNLVGELVDMARGLGLQMEERAATEPQTIPYSLIESLFQRKLEEAGIVGEISEKVARLNSREQRRSLFSLIEVAGEVVQTPGTEKPVMYHRFEGKALRSYRRSRYLPPGRGFEVSREGKASGYP